MASVISIPVATMGIGKAGAKNAAVLAVRILAVDDSVLQGKLELHAQEMAEQVAAKNKALTM
jgi:phosphoribosylcarboxyaminoimidazole (NCAIR) mutase